MTDTYVIRGRKQAWDKFSQYIYDVYADTETGFMDFCTDHADDMSPASTVEIDDLGVTLHLRMDGNWSGKNAEGTNVGEELMTSWLDEMVSDEELEESGGETEEAASGDESDTGTDNPGTEDAGESGTEDPETESEEETTA